MPQYLLTVVEPTGVGIPAPEVLEKIMEDVGAVDRAMREAGVWVFSGGLYPPDTATTLRPKADEVLVTDGPFAEGREHVGGFTIITAPDLDAALAWATKGSAACMGPVEVRPFQDDTEA